MWWLAVLKLLSLKNSRICRNNSPYEVDTSALFIYEINDRCLKLHLIDLEKFFELPLFGVLRCEVG